MVYFHKNKNSCNRWLIWFCLLNLFIFAEPNETFCDGDLLYRPQLPPFSETPQEENFDTRNPEEPSWMQQVPHESSTTDSEAEFSSPRVDRAPYRLPSSSSSYMLDLNVEDSTVHLMRPPNVESEEKNRSDSKIVDVPVEVNVIQTSQHRELVPISGIININIFLSYDFKILVKHTHVYVGSAEFYVII